MASDTDIYYALRDIAVQLEYLHHTLKSIGGIILSIDDSLGKITPEDLSKEE